MFFLLTFSIWKTSIPCFRSSSNSAAYIKGFSSFPKQSYSLTWDPKALNLNFIMALSILHSLLSIYMSVSQSGLKASWMQEWHLIHDWFFMLKTLPEGLKCIIDTQWTDKHGLKQWINPGVRRTKADLGCRTLRIKENPWLYHKFQRKITAKAIPEEMSSHKMYILCTQETVHSGPCCLPP